jgi:hypothetical protein
VNHLAAKKYKTGHGGIVRKKTNAELVLLIVFFFSQLHLKWQCKALLQYKNADSRSPVTFASSLPSTFFHQTSSSEKINTRFHSISPHIGQRTGGAAGYSDIIKILFSSGPATAAERESADSAADE